MFCPSKACLDLDFYDIRTGKRIGSLPTKERNRIKCIIVSNDNKIIASYDNNSVVKIWELESGRELMQLHGHDRSIESLALSADNKIVASDSDRRIKIWNAHSGNLLSSFHGHANLISGLLITPDSRFLISTGDRKIKIWNVLTGNKLSTIVGHDYSIKSIFLSNDGNILVSGDTNGTIRSIHRTPCTHLE